MEIDTETIIKQLETFQKTIDSIKQQKSKLEGELESHLKRKQELEEKAKKEIRVEIERLPEVKMDYEGKIQKKMAQIQSILKEIKTV